MKIVQTFWSSNIKDNIISNAAGWISPEFHWMSWALSSLQYKQYYDKLELVTDNNGKLVLIDMLKLPYDNVIIKLDDLNEFSPKLWALSKICSYSLQNEPFIHSDGDVYIWEKFDSHLERSSLLAQNEEINFEFYYPILEQLKTHFYNLPEEIIENLKSYPIIKSCNTGIIGGNEIKIFKEYAKIAISWIKTNSKQLEKIDLSTFNIVFEQLLYYSLAKKNKIKLTYLIKNENGFDQNYTGFAIFNEVPYKTKFIHTLGAFKKSIETCYHLGKRLRKDYPEFYYRILKICIKEKIILHNKAYSYKFLNPNDYDCNHFMALKDKKIDKKEDKYLYFYSKDLKIYENAEKLFSKPKDEILKQHLNFDKDSIFFQTKNKKKSAIILFNIQALNYEIIDLDNLGILIHKTFSNITTIENGFQIIGKYFNNNDLTENYDKFEQLIFSRLKEYIYLGTISWKN